MMASRSTELLEDRTLLTVDLSYSGTGSALTLSESAAGTDTVTISETVANTTVRIDLGASNTFGGGSTSTAPGLAYQNPGSPSTSQWADVSIATLASISTLTVNLGGNDDSLTIGTTDNEGITNISVDGGGGTDVVSLNAISVPGTLSVAAESISLNANVTTTGTQSYAGSVSLGADATIAGSAVSFTGTVDGGYALVVNASGATTFSAAVGGSTALTSLTTDAGGTVILQSVTTSGAQSYGEDATLNGTYTTTNSAFSVAGATALDGGTTVTVGSGNVTFTGDVDGANTLAVNSTGATLFSALFVGDGSSLTSLTTDAGGTVSVRNVTTTGAQSYGENATLNGTYRTTNNSAFSVAGTTTLGGGTAVIVGSGAVTFTGAVNGANTLEINSTAATLFSAAVGGATALTSLTTDAGGTVILQSVTTSGLQSYGDDATLNGTYTTTNAALSVAGTTTLVGDTSFNSGGGSILFGSTLTGVGKDLTIASGTAAGTTTFTGAVSGMGDGTGAAITIASTGLARFMSTVGGASGIVSSSSSGSTRFDGDVTLANGDTGSNFTGTTNLDGLNWSGYDGLTFTGAVTMSSGAVSLNSNGGNILLSSSLVGGGQDLTIASGTGAGTTTFTGAVSAVGDGTGAAITIDSTGLARFMSTVGGASGIVSSSASGSTRFDGDVTLTDGDTASSFATGWSDVERL